MEKIIVKGGREALKELARELLKRYAAERLADLGEITVLLPGSRAGRRLCELLAESCREERRLLIPPRVQTPRSFLRNLAAERCGRSLATDVETAAAWRLVLERAEKAKELRALFSIAIEEEEGACPIPLDELGETLQDLRLELAEAGLTPGDVLERESLLPGFESARWEKLDDLNKKFQSLLAEHGLLDEAQALLGLKEEQFSGPVWLVCQAEANPLLDAVLRDCQQLTKVMVGEAEWFDETGALRPEAPLPALPEKLRANIGILPNPIAEAEEIWRTLAKRPGPLSPSDVTIASQSADVTPFLKAFAEKGGLEIHEAQGIPWSATEPGQLVAALKNALQSPDEKNLLSLLRLPCLERGLARETEGAFACLEELLPEWQRKLRKHLGEYPEEWMFGRDSEGNDSRSCRVFRALQAFLDLWKKEKSEEDWAKTWEEAGKFLRPSGTPEDQEAWNQTESFCRKVARSRIKGRPVAGADFLGRLAAAGKKAHITLQTDQAALDFVGWQETVLDDSPIIFLCDVNEGVLPKAHGSDPFLPESLRKELGMQTSEQDFLRDRYYLRLLAGGRENEVFIYSPKQSASGERLMPSRLLCDESEEVAARAGYIRQFCDDKEDASREAGDLFARVFAPEKTTAKEEAQPFTASFTEVSASRLNDYKKCPLKFALRSRKIETPQETYNELTPALLGDLTHKVLERMASGKLEKTLEPGEEALASFLLEETDKVAKQLLGVMLPPMAAVQIMQLKEQFKAFARIQTEWETNGWEIARAESDLKMEVGDLTLKCKIDRLDRRTNAQGEIEFCVIDYKTGSKAKNDKEMAEDLQIPAYLMALGKEYPKTPRENWRCAFVFFSAAKDESPDFTDCPRQDDDQAVQDILARIGEGKFAGTYRSSACDKCDFEPLCRLQDNGYLAGLNKTETTKEA